LRVASVKDTFSIEAVIAIFLVSFSVNGLGFFGCGFLLCSGGVSLFHRFGIKFRGGHGGLGVVHGLFLGQHEFGVHIAIFVEKEGVAVVDAYPVATLHDEG
jgi:hypothetical protein